MSISDAQQGKLSQTVARVYAQDKKIPMLINIHDGRLIANSVAIRGDGTMSHPANPDYRLYTGSLKASLQERMAFIASSVGIGRARVVDSSAEAPEFDVAKATKDEIIAFAFTEFGTVLSEDTDIRTLRKQLMAASERAAPAAESLS